MIFVENGSDISRQAIFQQTHSHVCLLRKENIFAPWEHYFSIYINKFSTFAFQILITKK
jgi:hypothetical protein